MKWIETKKEMPPKCVEVLVYHPSAGYAIAEYGNHERWMRLPDMAPAPTHWAMLEKPALQHSAHLTLRTLRHLQAFFSALLLSLRTAFRRPSQRR